jgi:hypothetical protein
MLQEDFWQEVDQCEEGRTVPFVTSFEREGMFRIIRIALRKKFGEEVEALLPALHELNDAEKYTSIMETIITATTLDEIRQAGADLAAPTPRRKKSSNGDEVHVNNEAPPAGQPPKDK